MLYEVITDENSILKELNAQPSPLNPHEDEVASQIKAGAVVIVYIQRMEIDYRCMVAVITSYSIHYTKLYDRVKPLHRRRVSNRFIQSYHSL